MGFHEIKDENGKVVGHAIVCRRNTPQTCQTCGGRSRILCDFPVVRKGKTETCDRRCCDVHSRKVGPNRDYCLPHFNMTTQPEEQP